MFLGVFLFILFAIVIAIVVLSIFSNINHFQKLCKNKMKQGHRKSPKRRRRSPGRRRHSPHRRKVGSRASVIHGNADITRGGLTKSDLKYNKSGRIVSRRVSKRMKKKSN